MLAIVIPYFKIKFFEQTLASLANQSDQRFKVYIGNDASPEDPSSLLREYEGKFDFVYNRFENNLGSISLVKQWERCIEMIQGEEWIMILGDDDFLSLNVIQEFYKQFEELNTTSNVVRYSTVVLNEKDNTKSDLFIHDKLETGLEFSLRKLRGKTRSSLSEYFFKKEIFLKHGFVNFPDAFYSDDKAWLDFSEDKFIYTINESIVYIRISDISMSGNVKKNVLIKAEFEYLKFLFFNKLSLLSKDEDYFFILRKMENSFCHNKVKSFRLWFLLYCAYLKKINLDEFLRFQKRLLRMLLK